MVQAPARSTIAAEFEERFAHSLAMHQRSREVIPGGITHDGRHLRPFPASVERAEGGHKVTVDGVDLIDYAVGHGALLLGHNHPAVREAVADQLQRGTHFGAGHDGEVRWAELIRELVPSAEQVKFTSSGTEATLLAMRLARAATGKSTILKFEGHFHGWNDYALKGEKPPFDAPSIPGVPDAVLESVTVLPANDPAAVATRLAQGDVAGIIVEPSGASWAMVPLVDGFLQSVRDLATEHQAVLIFDEVITGFRWSPGGVQAKLGITPDLTTLAKIVAGGLPGGAVTGRSEIMELLAFRDDPVWNATRKVRHPGTFNANPLSAAAGIACLTICADGEVQRRCDDLAARLRAGMNATLTRLDAPGVVYGESSVFHVMLGQRPTNPTDGDLRLPEGIPAATLKQAAGALAGPLQIGMLLEGVDFFNSGGMLCADHTDADISHTLAAFERVVRRLGKEGLLSD